MTHDRTHDAVPFAVASGRPSVASSRRLTVTLFAAALVAFVLPFGTVSCGEPVSFTGVELATASVTGSDDELVDQIEAQGTLFALIAAASALLGLGLALAGRRGQGSIALVGLLALLFLPWLAGLGLTDFQVHEGFELAAASLLVIVALRARLLIRRRRARDRRTWPALAGVWMLGLYVAVTVALCVSSAGSLEAAGGLPS